MPKTVGINPDAVPRIWPDTAAKNSHNGLTDLRGS